MSFEYVLILNIHFIHFFDALCRSILYFNFSYVYIFRSQNYFITIQKFIYFRKFYHFSTQFTIITDIVSYEQNIVEMFHYIFIKDMSFILERNSKKLSNKFFLYLNALSHKFERMHAEQHKISKFNYISNYYCR